MTALQKSVFRSHTRAARFLPLSLYASRHKTCTSSPPVSEETQGFYSLCTDSSDHEEQQQQLSDGPGECLMEKCERLCLHGHATLCLELSLKGYNNKHGSAGSLAQCNSGWFQSTNKPAVINTNSSTRVDVLQPYLVGVKTMFAQASDDRGKLRHVDANEGVLMLIKYNQDKSNNHHGRLFLTLRL